VASVEKLKSGRYRGIAYPQPGVKVTTKGGTFKYERDALKAAMDLEVDLRRQAELRQPGEKSELATISWGEWWDLIVDSRARPTDAAASEASYVKNHVRPRWGDVPLVDIERDDIEKWAKVKLAEGYKPNSVQKMVAVLSVSLNTAVDQKVLKSSPAARIKLPRQRKTMKTWVPRQNQAKIADALTDEHRELIQFLGETGLRPNELCGLHADQIYGKILYVRTVYVLTKKFMRDWPKGQDVRKVPLTPLALEIARKRIAAVQANQTCGVPHYEDAPCSADILFRNSNTGRPYTPPKIRSIILAGARAAGVPGASGYALRRAVATYLGRSGVDLHRMMDIMGWKKAELAREYIQESPGARADLIKALAYAEAEDEE